MIQEKLQDLPWSEILAISFLAFVLIKLLAQSGWLNFFLLPLTGPLAAGKFLIFSFMGRTGPYWERLKQSNEVSNLLVFRARRATSGNADEAQPSAESTDALAKELAPLVRKCNDSHQWFEGPMQLALHQSEVVGLCRLFTFPRALGLGADRQVYRDIEHIMEFLEQTSKGLGLEWTVSNTIGISGRIREGKCDQELRESLEILRGTIYWRRKKSRATPPAE